MERTYYVGGLGIWFSFRVELLQFILDVLQEVGVR